MALDLSGPDPVTGILDTLLACLGDALAATPAGAPPRIEVAHGNAVTFDSPLGWVRPVRVFPSTEAFGSEDSAYSQRKQPFRWAVDVEVGVVRCTSTVQSQGNQPVLPSAADITSDSAMLLADAHALRVVAQYLHPWRGKVIHRPWEPIGPSGGMAGGSLQIGVPFNDCNPTR